MPSTFSKQLRKHLLLALVSGPLFLLAPAFAAEDAAQLTKRANNYLSQSQYQQALPLLQQAAAQGYATAQHNLGVMYERGEGVRQDYAQARAWYAKAAAQGSPDAQLNLGFTYSQGLGVRQDFGQARAWFEKAAAQGNAIAQYNLGSMYHQGQGVRQNRTTAKEWFGKACDNGDQDGCDAYRKLNQ